MRAGSGCTKPILCLASCQKAVRLKANFRSLVVSRFFFFESLWTDQQIQLLLTEIHFSCWSSIVPTIAATWNPCDTRIVFEFDLICYCNIKPRWTRQTQDACLGVTCLLNTNLRASRLSNRPPFLKCFAFPSRKIPNEARFEGRFRPYVCLSWVFVS